VEKNMKNDKKGKRPHYCGWGIGTKAHCKKLAVGRLIVEISVIGNPDEIDDTDIFYGCRDHLDRQILYWAKGGRGEKTLKEYGFHVVNKKMFPIHPESKA
jgi:hypothetical protein